MAAPTAWPTLIGSPVDWGYSTVTQQGLLGAELPYPRGKVLGGSIGVNAMVHLRAHHASYDAWAAAGATGWGYEDLVPYFRRSETANADRDESYRGSNGPMRVGPPAVAHPHTHAALAAVRECGFPTSSDLNGAEQEGATRPEMNIVDGVRQSAADAYLRPILSRLNLTVTTDALVTRLMLPNGRCTAVEYEAATERLTAQAGESVVLTAGAIGSRRLLMLSGVGDPTDLEKLDITTEVALPGVGKNLQDHPLAGIVYSAARAMPDGVNNHTDLVAALRSDPRLPAPDLQLLFADIPYHRPTLVGPPSGFTIGFSYLHPHSRGSVKLSSADPAIAPAVDPAFLSDERDVDGMLTALQLARRVGEADALAEWRGKEILPGPGALDVEQQKDFLRRSTDSYFHAAGTCAMGTDAVAVVDSELRVRGLDGLRIADASVMPTLVGANTNATVLAIAERAADLITR